MLNTLYAHQMPSIISSFEQADLELFGSVNNSHPGFYKKIDYTRTDIGSHMLKKNLAHPTCDVKTLSNRQLLIEWLVQHPEKFKEITAHLDDFQLFAYGLEQSEKFDTLTQEILKGFYYRFSFIQALNKSPLALDILNMVHGASLLSPVVEHLILHFALEFIQEKMAQTNCDNHHHEHDHTHHHGHHGHHCLGHLEAGHDASAVVKGLFWSIRLAHLGMHLFSVKEMVEHIVTRLAVINALHKKLSAAACAIKALYNFANLLNDIPEFSHHCEEFKNIRTLFFENENASFKSFMNLVNNDHFLIDQELGYFSSIGSTLYAQQLIDEVIVHVQPALQALAQLDVYSSCATLYQSLAAEKRVCFAQFTTNENPFLKIVNGWNMMLPQKQAVACSVTLGEQFSKMIVTGPNKAGKSTFMKGVALNILLAQTFGIAAAEEMVLKPFAQIITYINIADDIANNQSMFVAEIVRADQCISRLKSLTDQESAFILIDDSLFKGTNPELGQKAAYDFVEQLAYFKSAVGLIATHLPILTTLEEHYPSIFRNYTIKLAVSQLGVTSSLFTLENGISTSHSFILLEN